MNGEDIFIGSVAMVLGAAAVFASAVNWDASFQLRKARWIERRLGRAGARVVFALLGLGFLVWGAALVFGLPPLASRPTSRAASAQGRLAAGDATLRPAPARRNGPWNAHAGQDDVWNDV